MIFHIDTDNPKPIEQKVRELILKKLYIKVNEDKIFIGKENFIDLVLKDIVALATANHDIESALKISLELQPEYKEVPETKRMELKEALVEFENEVGAYRIYLDDIEDGIPDDEIYDDVLFTLNTEHELLEKKLHELIMQSLGRKLSEKDAQALNTNRHQILDVFANQVKLLATYDNIEDAVDAAFYEFEDYPQKHSVTKEAIRNEYLRFAPLAKSEISAYKLASSLEDQNAEIPMILASVRQLLHLKD